MHFTCVFDTLMSMLPIAEIRTCFALSFAFFKLFPDVKVINFKLFMDLKYVCLLCVCVCVFFLMYFKGAYFQL